jgi:hypothetical protein
LLSLSYSQILNTAPTAFQQQHIFSSEKWHPAYFRTHTCIGANCNLGVFVQSPILEMATDPHLLLC